MKQIQVTSSSLINKDTSDYLRRCHTTNSLIDKMYKHSLFSHINEDAFENFLETRIILGFGLAKMRCLNLLRGAARHYYVCTGVGNFCN